MLIPYCLRHNVQFIGHKYAPFTDAQGSKSPRSKGNRPYAKKKRDAQIGKPVFPYNSFQNDGYKKCEGRCKNEDKQKLHLHLVINSHSQTNQKRIEPIITGCNIFPVKANDIGSSIGGKHCNKAADTCIQIKKTNNNQDDGKDFTIREKDLRIAVEHAIDEVGKYLP